MKKLLLFAFLILNMLLALGITGCDDDDSTENGTSDDDIVDDDGFDDDVLNDDVVDDDVVDDDVADDDAIDDDVIDDDLIDDDAGDDDTGDDDTGDDDTAPIDCPAVITRQPYLQLATQTSMNVLWRTDEPGDSFIAWGPTPDLGNFVRKNDLVKHHELTIDGLDPGTRYYYLARSCLDETGAASFRTAPTADTPFNFVAFGDNQSGWETFTEIAAMMEEEDPWLAISAGDSVDDGWEPEDYEQQLFGPAESLWRSTPLYIAIGNHEANSILFFDSFHFPNEPHNYYAFTYGNVFFIALALDTAHIAIPGSPQYRFFVDALTSPAAQQADFRVVFFHTPPWCEGWEGYEGEWLVRAFIVPLIEQHNVDVYFNGHTHDFERGYLNGVTSYIIGGAGGALDTWARDVEHITVYESVHHYVRVEVDSTAMLIEAIDLDGDLIDTWEIW